MPDESVREDTAPQSSTLPSTQFMHPFLFASLPRELRDKIWKLSLPPPRLIEVRAEEGKITIPGRAATRAGQNSNERPFLHVWVKKLPVPKILHVCQESRIIGLKHYELVFDSNPRPSREDLSDLHDLPPVRGGKSRELVFPFETKAMAYVDLERDIMVTGNRKLACRGPPGRKSKDGNDDNDDPSFAAWQVVPKTFQIAIFREMVPREVLVRIRNFAVRYIWTMREIFPVRSPMGMMSNHHVKVIKDAFQPREELGADYIDGLINLHGVPPHMKGRVRLLKNLVELAHVIAEDALWD